jgi:hypothetical protein
MNANPALVDDVTLLYQVRRVPKRVVFDSKTEGQKLFVAVPN